jgi:hypothetical protein
MEKKFVIMLENNSVETILASNKVDAKLKAEKKYEGVIFVSELTDGKYS